MYYRAPNNFGLICWVLKFRAEGVRYGAKTLGFRV